MLCLGGELLAILALDHEDDPRRVVDEHRVDPLVARPAA